MALGIALNPAPASPIGRRQRPIDRSIRIDLSQSQQPNVARMAALARPRRLSWWG